jgi:hypothetical protein
VSTNMISVRVRTNTGTTAEINGEEGVVQRLLSPYLEDGIAEIATISQNESAPTSPNVNALNTNGAVKNPIDLVELYQKAKPEGQYEEIALIGYYLKNKGMKDWSLPEVEACYRELLMLPVMPPKSLEGAVKNTVTRRNDWVVRTSPNRFTITLKGEAHIVSMLRR